MKFVVYSKDHCPFCERAKAIIKAKGHDYAENKLGVDFDRETLLELFPDARTFPQIVLLGEEANQRIGGCTELEQWFSVQELSL